LHRKADKLIDDFMKHNIARDQEIGDEPSLWIGNTIDDL